MLCDKCKQRQANVHIRQSINGVTTERNLCEVCAREEDGVMSVFSSGSFFNDLFATSLLKRGSGRVGNLFDIAPQMSRTGNDRYDAEFMGLDQPYDTGIELPEIGLAPQKDSEKPKNQDNLKAQLDQAIRDENYEKAAEIRDLIKKKKEKE